MGGLNLIGISGTDGSGKDSLGQLLAERYNWHFLSVTDILRDELKRRGIILKRQNLRKLSAEWRKDYGLGVLVDKAIRVYGSSQDSHSGLVIASIRNVGEVDRIHELEGKVVWVDADPKIRYARIANRNRGSEDHVTFEEFLTEENAQSNNLGDDTGLNLNGVKAKADIFIENQNNNLEDFYVKAESALKGFI
jgi:cytidylate kinase